MDPLSGKSSDWDAGGRSVASCSEVTILVVSGVTGKKGKGNTLISQTQICTSLPVLVKECNLVIQLPSFSEWLGFCVKLPNALERIWLTQCHLVPSGSYIHPTWTVGMLFEGFPREERQNVSGSLGLEQCFPLAPHEENKLAPPSAVTTGSFTTGTWVAKWGSSLPFQHRVRVW